MPKRLSKNFTEEELRCDDYCEEARQPEMSIVILLELVRLYFGSIHAAKCRVDVTNGCRCHPNNEAIQKKWYPINNNGKKYVPNSSKSRHMKKDAADFKVFIRVFNIGKGSEGKLPLTWEQIDPKDVTKYLDNMFPNSLGIGTYHNRNHADTRKTKARW